MRVAAINDLSGFGKCSLIADIGVLSSMGIEVCPVPTALFTAQTGFPSYYMHDASDMIVNCRKEWKKMKVSFDGIITGYMPSIKEADEVFDFANDFKNKDTVLLVDPVMGDGGKSYSNYSEVMLSRIKRLVEIADIITPNLTELMFLAGIDEKEISRKFEIWGMSGSSSASVTEIDKHNDKGNYEMGGLPSVSVGKVNGNEANEYDSSRVYDEIFDIAYKVRTHDKQTIVVTGISEGNGKVSNLVIYPGGKEIVKSKSNGLSYSGTGDLFAASLMGNVLYGRDMAGAVENTVSFIGKAIAATDSNDRNYGVDFEKVLQNNSGGERL
ncbi:bifunctional hydroxymethylpyrimidine kinase/phosphomethylpyrimidine kinase [Butyrivibrio sp. YAB3001]|uniref:bifunctional hydroxymethylpyrimidine kinase/phosphomethylpyrimidine kinase n=1 Tax=Butyrivibrio sp. YAB3001 TaxID=1520812 RepID=UPI0008F620AA|nr:bifunctional hydroxymethylpyrimidine kinase/phosphomethylpyrimidine kinase [Butyrivibrio sp. YAB3001]SFC60682.1 pyridoxine kinase [Butyrivibrio sp. YAB3001]